MLVMLPAGLWEDVVEAAHEEAREGECLELRTELDTRPGD
jgi:hypothetical protein